MVGQRATSRRKRPLERVAASNVDVLAWPSSSPLATDTGYAIGWWTETPESSKWPLQVMVVAGILSMDYASICQRIERLQNDCCYCCTCPNSDKDAKGNHSFESRCGGCTRKLCFGKLQVLAYVSNQPSRLAATGTRTTDLPTVHLSSSSQLDSNLPNAVANSRDDGRFLKWTQLLIYNDTDAVFDDHYYLYKSAFEHSYFSQELLARLTHARTVMSSFKQHLELETHSRPAAAVSTTTKSRQRDPVDSDGTYSVQTLNRMFSRAVTLLVGKSVFARHLSCTALPFLVCKQSFQKISTMKQQRRNRQSRMHFGVACSGCRKPKRLIQDSHYVEANQFISAFNNCVLACLDLSLGFLFGVTLVISLQSSTIRRLVSSLVDGHYQVLHSALNWLEMFPIGFKLNVRLTQNMGNNMHWLIHVHAVACEATLSCLDTQPGLVSALLMSTTGIFGATGLVALLCDLWRVASSHITLLSFGFRRIYAAELYLLVALWRLFRGKKHNILRKRTDTMEYDSMQLLLGTILFAIALFMFTTILVYHVFFTALNAAAVLVTVSLVNLLILIGRFPFGRLCLLSAEPQWFTDDVYLGIVSNDTAISYQTSEEQAVTCLRTKSGNLSRLLSSVLGDLGNTSFAWLTNCLLYSLVSGKESGAFVLEVLPLLKNESG